jgi:hypothetical protein
MAAGPSWDAVEPRGCQHLVVECVPTSMGCAGSYSSEGDPYRVLKRRLETSLENGVVLREASYGVLVSSETRRAARCESGDAPRGVSRGTRRAA